MAEDSEAGAVRELMADYAEVMREVQVFETVLLGLALTRGYSPDQLGTEGWHKRVEDLYSRTAGGLVKAARIDDEDLAEQVNSLVSLRNRLVHGWLIVALVDVATGRRTIEDKRGELRVLRDWFSDVRQAVETEYAKALNEAGDEPMSVERLADLWREDESSPENG